MTAILDRIEQDLVEAAARQESPSPRPRAVVNAIRGLALIALAGASAGAAGAVGVDPFARLFANDPVSQAQQNSTRLEQTATDPNGGEWRVTAYKRRDGSIAVSAAFDDEGDRTPPVSWVGADALHYGFSHEGPARAQTRSVRDERGQHVAVFGLVDAHVKNVSLRLNGTSSEVTISEGALTAGAGPQTGTTGEPKAVTVRSILAPIAAQEGAAVATLKSQMHDGSFREQELPIAPS